MKFKFNRRKLTFRRFSYYLLSGTIVISCITNGIFAKFTTEDYGGDGARVADFGVVVSISGDLFSTAYNKYIEGNVTSNNPTTFDANEDTVSVKASSKYVKDKDGKDILNNVVAPGTKNDVGINVSVTGTPETDCQLNYTLLGFETIYLSGGSAGKGTSYGLMVPFEKGIVNESNFGELVKNELLYKSVNKTDKNSGKTYQEYTKVLEGESFGGDVDYYKLKDEVTVPCNNSYMPIKYYINKKTESKTTKNLLNDSYKCDVFATTNMLQKFANNTFGGTPYGGIYCFGDLGGLKTYETGVTIDEKFSITWEWPYHQTTDTSEELAWCNDCDTILGYIAAGKNVVKAEVKENGIGDYSNNLSHWDSSFETDGSAYPDYNLDITFDYSITFNQVD